MAGHEFSNFPASHFDQMTLSKGHDTSPGHQQSLCDLWTSNISPNEVYGLDTNFAQTDRQTDKVIAIYPSPLTAFAGGIYIFSNNLHFWPLYVYWSAKVDALILSGPMSQDVWL